ncbi:MAG: NAD-dependent epimerase/dehydratase family protein, partial [Paracoccaceae bacterium]
RNAMETALVCQAARAARAAHVVMASTAAVYAPGPGELAETDPLAPANPYGAAKLAAEQAAARELEGSATGLTILRIGNVAGADALLGGVGPAVLDPVAGQEGGPHRSYIGPQVLGRVLGDLIGHLARGQVLPQVLNVAQPGVVAMGDLLTAAGRDWQFGPPKAEVVPRVVLSTERLDSLVTVPKATASGIVKDLQDLKGRWP